MDLSSLNQSLNILSNKIKSYLDNPVNIEFANYEQQRDVVYVSNKYNEIVHYYSDLLSLITETQYFISQCKKVSRLLSSNTSLEKAQKDKIKTAISIIEEISVPLYNEKERLKTIEMMYRAIYNQKDF
jgi:uncharacterized protein YdaL